MFDLEFGQPAASSSLPASRPPFRDILGCFGHQAIGKDITQGGIDLLYCSHQVLVAAPYLLLYFTYCYTELRMCVRCEASILIASVL